MTLSYFKKRFNQYADSACREYKISKLRLFLGFVGANIAHGASIKDYFTFKFFLLSRKGRKEFVTNRKHLRYYSKHNSPEAAEICNDKERTLVHFDKLIERDWVGVEHRNTREEYERFAARHSRAILKPLSLSGGHGIEVVDTNALPDGKSLFDYCNERRMIAEELISNHHQMAKMNPTSLNTLRVMVKGGELVGVIFRFGANGSLVDNASSGGIYAEVDSDIGAVISCGMDYNGDVFIKHPDTEVLIPGFQIPMWDSVVAYSKKAAEALPGIAVLGLDIAITESGPTLIEANARPDPAILQTPRNRGVAYLYK